MAGPVQPNGNITGFPDLIGGESVGYGFSGAKFGFTPQDGNEFWNGMDFLLPGYSLLDKGFDFTGKNAAQAQYNSQLALQQQAQGYNSAEADKTRQWQKMMADTEIQRRVADLKAAGLNPWLAISGSLSGMGANQGASAQSSSGSAEMANNKISQAAGLIAMALRIFFTKK